MHLTAKRTISAILAALMMIFVLTSCQSSEETPDITRGNGSIEAPTAAATTAATTGTTAATTGTTAAATTQKSNASSGSNNSSQSSQQTLANIAANSGQSVALVGSLINALGYNYDAKENVFYTELDSWQRSGNYMKHYDAIAAFGNMHYLTTRVDFNYDGLAWRLQFWKGQYGAFGGAEIGVYNKIPGQTDELYYCADDDHLMYMSYTLYKTPADYHNGVKYFTRGWQKHWWLTGFKPGTVSATDLVMSARIRTYDSQMAAAMEKGLLAAGFKQGDAQTKYDTFRRSGFDFFILWYSVGDTNYDKG